MSNSRAFALDESSAINFKPYDSSNHKAQLVDFIRLVDNHAIIPPKIKVNPLRDLANKYLNILRGRAPSPDHEFHEFSSPLSSPISVPTRSPSRPRRTRIASDTPSPPPTRVGRSPGRTKTARRAASLTPSPRGRSNSRPDAARSPARTQSTDVARSPARTQSTARRSAVKSRSPVRASVARSPAKTPSRSSKRSAARASVSPSPKQSTTRRRSPARSTRGRSPARPSAPSRSTRGQSPARPRPSKPSKQKEKPTSPPRRRRSASPSPRRARSQNRSPPQKQRIQSPMNKKRHVTFARSQPTRYSNHPTPDHQDSSQSEDFSVSEESSQANLSESSQNSLASRSSDSDHRPTTQRRQAKKAIQRRPMAKTASPRTRTSRVKKTFTRLKPALVVRSSSKAPNHTIDVDQSGTDDTSDHEYRYRTRSGRRPPPSPAYPALDDLSYAEEGRQDVNSYPRPKISPFLQLPPERNLSEKDNAPTPVFNPYNPCPKRRRYVQLQGGNQTYAAPGLDHRDRHGPDPSDWRFTPASIPFCPTRAETSNPPSQIQTQLAPSYGYDTFQQPPVFQQPSVFHNTNTSQSDFARPYAYQPPATHFDYSPRRFTDHTYTPHLNPHQPSGPAACPKPEVPSGPKPFDYSQYWNTRPTQSQKQNVSFSQGSAVPSQKDSSGFNFSCPSVGQEKPPPPPPNRAQEKVQSLPRFSTQSCPFGTQEKAPPPPKYGQSSSLNLPPARFGQFSSVTTFKPSTVEPTRNNPFMPDASSWDPKPPPVPPKSDVSTNLWGSKPSTFQSFQSSTGSTSTLTSFSTPKPPTTSFATPKPPPQHPQHTSYRAESEFLGEAAGHQIDPQLFSGQTAHIPSSTAPSTAAALSSTVAALPSTAAAPALTTATPLPTISTTVAPAALPAPSLTTVALPAPTLTAGPPTPASVQPRPPGGTPQPSVQPRPPGGTPQPPIPNLTIARSNLTIASSSNLTPNEPTSKPSKEDGETPPSEKEKSS
ncbi:hypothetical protein PGTUg99_026008 [Puccinia graminis f. sp. tritici]|uniref:Uncharacterized protein n=1 Tax=Puccinia graminis f. sp. tritici TaxID=56615 RepID=A0A5B0SCN7_PUCGR|nr:hypothetical protein PGTUg99_026008 [Puccinia graminis f. sp. tritici]